MSIGQTKRNYENGVAHGTMPYGYKRENGKIVIVEDEAKVVQQIFRLYIDGYGTRRIANTLKNKVIIMQLVESGFLLR